MENRLVVVALVNVALVEVRLVNTAESEEMSDENQPVEEVALVILLLTPEILVA